VRLISRCDMSRSELFEKMFLSIFDPKKDERILLLYDVPTPQIKDSEKWMKRRNLAQRWFDLCSILSERIGFSVELMDMDATGKMNGLISDDVKNRLKNYDIIIAITEFSVTSSLVSLVKSHKESIRCASMPQADQRMMNSVFSMDYTDVKRYAHLIKDLLEEAEYAHIRFNTNDTLVIDLRNRHAGADDGDCTYPGACINLPSGEGFIAPYEGVDDEQQVFGTSNTQGILPLIVDDQIIRCKIRENRIVGFDGPKLMTDSLNQFFDEFENRRNIAELGIGCNPKARVTGNIIEDEKVGVHIAYGTSEHIGGRIKSDLHTDIVYAKGCPVTADKVSLNFLDRESVDLVENAEIRYELLR